MSSLYCFGTFNAQDVQDIMLQHVRCRSLTTAKKSAPHGNRQADNPVMTEAELRQQILSEDRVAAQCKTHTH